MKFRYTLLISVIAVAVCCIIGLVQKKDYTNYNDIDKPFERFEVGVMTNLLIDGQIGFFEENVEDGEEFVVLAVECIEEPVIRYKCATQKVKVIKSFRGGDDLVGKTVEYECSKGIDNYSVCETDGEMALGFFNKMIPGKKYLIFINGMIKDTPYCEDTGLAMRWCFCYDELPIIPYNVNAMNADAPYTAVKDSEFFVQNEEIGEKLLQVKKRVLNKYPL